MLVVLAHEGTARTNWAPAVTIMEVVKMVYRLKGTRLSSHGAKTHALLALAAVFGSLSRKGFRNRTV